MFADPKTAGVMARSACQAKSKQIFSFPTSVPVDG